MIDPFTAFAAAQAAINGIKAVIQAGKDINGITGDLLKFMEAKDAVQVAANNPKKFKSDTAQAMETVMHAKKLADDERALKELLIYSGNGDVWTSMLMERNKLQAERKAAQATEQRAKAKRQAAITQVAYSLLYALLLCAAIVITVWITYEFVQANKG